MVVAKKQKLVSPDSTQLLHYRDFEDIYNFQITCNSKGNFIEVMSKVRKFIDGKIENLYAEIELLDSPSTPDLLLTSCEFATVLEDSDLKRRVFEEYIIRWNSRKSEWKGVITAEQVPVITPFLTKMEHQPFHSN